MTLARPGDVTFDNASFVATGSNTPIKNAASATKVACIGTSHQTNLASTKSAPKEPIRRTAESRLRSETNAGQGTLPPRFPVDSRVVEPRRDTVSRQRIPTTPSSTDRTDVDSYNIHDNTTPVDSTISNPDDRNDVPTHPSSSLIVHNPFQRNSDNRTTTSLVSMFFSRS